MIDYFNFHLTSRLVKFVPTNNETYNRVIDDLRDPDIQWLEVGTTFINKDHIQHVDMLTEA